VSATSFITECTGNCHVIHRTFITQVNGLNVADTVTEAGMIFENKHSTDLLSVNQVRRWYEHPP